MGASTPFDCTGRNLTAYGRPTAGDHHDGWRDLRLRDRFSRTDHWIAFHEKAKALGYRLNLFFICTSDPVMSAAKKIVDGLWLYDNTGWDLTPLLLGWWEDQQKRHIAESIPRCAEPFFR